jgi:hypothetical protein
MEDHADSRRQTAVVQELDIKDLFTDMNRML